MGKVRFFDAILIAIFLAMLFLNLLQVFYRYALNSPLSWSEELSRYLLIWSVFFGIGAVTRDDAHIVIDFIGSPENPGPFRQAVDWTRRILSFVIMATFAYLVLEYVISVWNRGTSSPAMGIPMAYVAVSMVIGSAMGLFYFGRDIVQRQ